MATWNLKKRPIPGASGRREKGILAWESGGFANKRGKYGQALANSYRFNLPESVDKGDDTVSSSRTSQCPPAGQGSVLLEDTTVSSSATLQCPPGGHQQNSIRIDNTILNTDTEQKENSGSGFKLMGSRLDRVLF